MRLAKSQQTLLSAGGDLARVHGRLLAIGKDLNVISMEDDCPGRSSPDRCRQYG